MSVSPPVSAMEREDAVTPASAPATDPVASWPPPGVDWAGLRPLRNNNPLDLRLLGPGHKWPGQSGEDRGPGGPFAIFPSRVEGWESACRNMLAYQDLHSIHTIAGIVSRWAPPADGNDTAGYIRRVCERTGLRPEQQLSLRNGQTMLAILKAMAAEESKPEVSWPQDEIYQGMRLAGLTI